MSQPVVEFTWRQAANPRQLGLWELAPDSPGFYELGFMRSGQFEPKYGGRASELNLRQRLRQHFLGSHNRSVARNSGQLWYRCKALPTAAHARLVEAHYVTAFEYEFNKRQEWSEFFRDV
jgi:hypothetical protein